MPNFTSKKWLPALLVFVLFIFLIVALSAIFNNTDNRKRAAVTNADFQIYPAQEIFQAGETKTFEVKTTFSGAAPSESIDYLKMTISFPSEYFKVPDDNYVSVFFAGQKNLERIVRVDGPVASNQSGKIIVEVAAATPGSGPSTSGPATLARFNLTAIKDTPSSLPMTVLVNQIVNSSSINLTTTSTEAMLQTGDAVVATITPTPLPTGINCDRSLGDANCDGVINVGDFDIWMREFTGEITTTRADFNSSGKIDLVDLEVWRRNTSSF